MENTVVDFHEIINSALLNQLRKDKGLTFADMEKLTHISESTIKNILLCRTRNPSVDTLRPICKVLGIPVEIAYEHGDIEDIKNKIERQGIKEENVPVLALKEIYDHQIATINKTNEEHINNIRSHYEQHHADLKENYEKRLADKREIIDSQNEHIKTLKRNLRTSVIGLTVCLVVFIALLIAEVLNPNLGWIQF